MKTFDTQGRQVSVAKAQNLLPVGTILMFNGTGWLNNFTLPGWYKCDGSNGTPNLVNKFVRSEAASGNTDGADTHTLSEAEIPSHNHTQNQHRHLVPNLTQRVINRTGAAGSFDKNDGGFNTEYTDYQTPTNNVTGGGTAHENMPAYYSLIFITRVE